MKQATTVFMGQVVLFALAALAAPDDKGATPPAPSPGYRSDHETPVYQTIPIKFVMAEYVAYILGGAVVDMPPIDSENGNLERVRRNPKPWPSGAWGGGLQVPDGMQSIVAIRQRNVLVVYGTREAISGLDPIVRALDQPTPVVELDLILVVGDPKVIPRKADTHKSVPRSETDWNAAWEELRKFPTSADWRVCLNTTLRVLNDECASATTDIPGGNRWAELDVIPLFQADSEVNLHTTIALRPGHGELQTVLTAHSHEILSLRGLHVDPKRELMVFIRPRVEESTAKR